MSIGRKRLSPITKEITDKEAQLIHALRERTADLIDICEQLKTRDPRLASIAQTSYEEACMWAIRSIMQGN